METPAVVASVDAAGVAPAVGGDGMGVVWEIATDILPLANALGVCFIWLCWVCSGWLLHSPLARVRGEAICRT